MNEDDRVELVASLFAALKHGDQDHKDWLFEAIGAFFAGKPVPVPRGSGNKEKRIAELEAELASLQGADTVTEAACMCGQSPCPGHSIEEAAELMAAPTAQDDTGARLDAVWNELQSLLPQSGVGAEIQDAWDRLRSLLAVPVRADAA